MVKYDERNSFYGEVVLVEDRDMLTRSDLWIGCDKNHMLYEVLVHHMNSIGIIYLVML